MGGGFDLLESLWNDVPRFLHAFRSGDGIPWGDHHPSMFCGTERFFRTGYQAYLASEWIPALEDVVAKLERGGSVADLGCGHGVSSVVIAEAFARASVVGSDVHAPSIEHARAEAAGRGLEDRLRFEVAGAQDFGGSGYDLVCTCDCLHDMGDPVGAAVHIREALADDGTWLLVEPFANDRLEENLNPIGRIFYGASTLVCCANALSQEGGYSLGAQAGEARLRGGRAGGGLHALPPGGGDAVQPDPRGATVARRSSEARPRRAGRRAGAPRPRAAPHGRRAACGRRPPPRASTRTPERRPGRTRSRGGGRSTCGSAAAIGKSG